MELAEIIKSAVPQKARREKTLAKDFSGYQDRGK